MRVKRGKRKKQRHKKYLKAAKGYRGAGSKRYRTARNLVEKAMQYSTRDRKVRKREYRALWITRINAACRENGMSYSAFISGMKKAGVILDRRVLQEIATNDSDAMSQLVSLAKDSIS